MKLCFIRYLIDCCCFLGALILLFFHIKIDGGISICGDFSDIGFTLYREQEALCSVVKFVEMEYIFTVNSNKDTVFESSCL